MKKDSSKWKVVLLTAGALAIGWAAGAMFSGGGDPHTGHQSGAAGANASAWTCSMHAQVQQPKPGKCPICAMDLIPASSLPKAAGTSRELVMTEAAKQLAKISTVPVERRLVEAEIRLVGKVAFDETRTRTISARFPARIDRLYVDYTGIQVRKGDHLARIYSPELLTAQQELLSAIKFSSNVETAREKLRLWDLSETRIAEIEKRGKPSDQLDIDAQIGGIVIEKRVNEGDYVKTGEPLFKIADLSTVWVKLDAYESDAPWLRYGQPVTFEAEAVPGKTYEGTIAFIAPTLDPKSRTIDIRVNAENPDRTLKPDMFVEAVVRPTLAAGGRVIARDLKGKWISPMHPEIVRDAPGPCPVCGMALVKAEELGYSVLEETEEPPLIVPASAVLKTGKRSLVYVENPKAKEPTYEGRVVVLGPRAGNHYLVEEGLQEGERVVTQGNFKIDSALQIVARPSMMNPLIMEHFEAPDVFRQQLGSLFQAYEKLRLALAADDLERSKTEASAVLAALEKIDGSELNEDAQTAWNERETAMTTAVVSLTKAKKIEALRVAFEPLSDNLARTLRSFQPLGLEAIYQAHCPMAFDFRGADWLQADEEIRNPYFGAEMLNCGSIKDTLLSDSETPEHEHGK